MYYAARKLSRDDRNDLCISVVISVTHTHDILDVDISAGWMYTCALIILRFVIIYTYRVAQLSLYYNTIFFTQSRVKLGTVTINRNT